MRSSRRTRRGSSSRHGAPLGPELVAGVFTRVPWESEEGDGGVTKLTVTHELEGAPKTATLVAGASRDEGGGWSWILSDLKTLLETGKSLAG